MVSRQGRLLVILVVLLLRSDAIGRAAADDAWQRAVQRNAPSDQIVATRLELREDGRDERTGAACRNDDVFRVRCMSADRKLIWDSVATTDFAGRNADPDAQCVSALDGVRQSGEISIPTTGVTPLSVSEQKRVRVRVTNETRIIEGRECRVHSFEWRQAVPKRGRVMGRACLDEATDLPLVIEFEPRDPPKGVRRVAYAAHYGPVLEKGWAMVRIDLEFFLPEESGADSPVRMTVQLSEHAAFADLARPGACEK